MVGTRKVKIAVGIAGRHMSQVVNPPRSSRVLLRYPTVR